jgi:hypothetical protein
VSHPVHSVILHEIVRVIESRGRVPERVRIRGKEYNITYLDDHRQRLEEALRRRDTDRVNMLYGQLSSKVKYQLQRHQPSRRATPTKPRRPPVRTRSPRPADRKQRASALSKKPAKKSRIAAKKTSSRKKGRAFRAARS